MSVVVYYASFYDTFFYIHLRATYNVQFMNASSVETRRKSKRKRFIWFILRSAINLKFDNTILWACVLLSSVAISWYIKTFDFGAVLCVKVWFTTHIFFRSIRRAPDVHHTDLIDDAQCVCTKGISHGQTLCAEWVGPLASAP